MAIAVTLDDVLHDRRMTLTELMIPAYANFGGKIHGGILLSLMDKVAYACAAKHSGKYCVTVSVDGVEFLQPVEVGEMVSLLASVNHVFDTATPVGGDYQAAAPGALSGPPAPPRDGRSDIGDLFECFTF